MAITDWPLGERPREKLLRTGASSLSIAELLAIFIQTGTKGKTAIDLARELLHEFKTLHGIFSVPSHQMAKRPGLGKAKSAMLQAALELGRRYLEEELTQNLILNSREDTKKYLSAKMGLHKQEVFACLFLNNRHHLIHYQELFYGTINCSSIYPRIIVQKALEYNASALIFAHNHPSGISTPSQSDITTTKNLISILEHLDIRVLDHIIVAGNQSTSLVELGCLP